MFPLTELFTVLNPTMAVRSDSTEAGTATAIGRIRYQNWLHRPMTDRQSPIQSPSTNRRPPMARPPDRVMRAAGAF
jgi:hypothetical protein